MHIQRPPSKSVLAFSLLAISCGAPETKPSSDVTRPAAKPEKVKVVHFYATPGAVSEGEDVQVCYGVEGADSVEMTPHVRDLSPGSNRCFSFTPKRSGSYTLTARGEGGEDSAELTIQVSQVPKELPPVLLLTLFRASSQRVAAGETVTLCYAVEEATEVVISPAVAELEPVSRCFTTVMDETTTFRLTATGPDGGQETRELTVVVN